MGRGRKPSRGGSRRFTDVETLKQQSRDLSRQKNEVLDEDDEDEDDEGENVVINRQGAVGELPPSESESESDSEDEGAAAKSSGDKSKAGASKAPVGNTLQERNKKINDLTLESLDINDEKRGLNRKEREAVAKEEAKRRYQAATAAGKTDEAKADLARLAIIRQEREEAKKRRELEQQAKEAAAKARADARKSGQSLKKL